MDETLIFIRLYHIHVYVLSQIQREFDRVVSDRQVNFLTIKMRWLEVQPKLLELAAAEENGHVSSLMKISTDEMDEGQYAICVLNRLNVMHNTCNQCGYHM